MQGTALQTLLQEKQYQSQSLRSNDILQKSKSGSMLRRDSFIQSKIDLTYNSSINIKIKDLRSLSPEQFIPEPNISSFESPVARDLKSLLKDQLPEKSNKVSSHLKNPILVVRRSAAEVFQKELNSLIASSNSYSSPFIETRKHCRDAFKKSNSQSPKSVEKQIKGYKKHASIILINVILMKLRDIFSIIRRFSYDMKIKQIKQDQEYSCNQKVSINQKLIIILFILDLKKMST